MNKVVNILVKRSRGEDDYRIFSIRVKKEYAEKLDAIAAESNRSRNDIITSFLEYCLQHYEIVE